MSKPSILITGRIPSVVVSKLEAVGELDVYRGGELPHNELCARVPGKQALVSSITDQIDKVVIDAGTDLRVIANIAVGYNNIDVGYARARGIIVTNTPDVLTDATADLTFGLILSVTRRIVEGDRLVRAGNWKGWALDFMLGAELKDRQLGIVGMGRIGRAVASRAAAFGMRIAFTDEIASMVPYERMSLDRLLATSDVVTLHVPLVPDTRHMIDRRALMRMKRSSFLINTSRGPVVDEEALAWALREGLIAGAALDVYENEPKVPEALTRFDNVVLSPHLGSATTETRTAMADLAARNVIAVLAGEPPVTPVPDGQPARTP